MRHKCEICQQPADDWIMVPYIETAKWVCKLHADRVGVFHDYDPKSGNFEYQVKLIENYDWQNWWCNHLTVDQRVDRIKVMFEEEKAKHSVDHPIKL